MDWFHYAIVCGVVVSVYCGAEAIAILCDRKRRLLSERIVDLCAAYEPTSGLRSLTAPRVNTAPSSWGKFFPGNQRKRADYQLRLFKAGIYRPRA
ncbi:MAG: hypothetical protein QM811_21515 [Pirellulales bacterium]